jgi:CBS domain-containing protein
MNVIEIMTTRVISISPEATVREAIRKMLDNSIGGLVVLDDSRKLVGVITEGDLIRRSEIGTERMRSSFAGSQLGEEIAAHEYVRAYGQKVADVITHNPMTVTESTPVVQVVDLMERHHIRRLPVVRGEKVVGVVARSDVLRALWRSLDDRSTTELSDNAIRVKLLEICEQEAWSPRSQIDVDVKNGVVELRGMTISENVHRAILVAAENVPGIKAVRDRLGDTIAPPRDQVVR